MGRFQQWPYLSSAINSLEVVDLQKCQICAKSGDFFSILANLTLWRPITHKLLISEEKRRPFLESPHWDLSVKIYKLKIEDNFVHTMKNVQFKKLVGVVKIIFWSQFFYSISIYISHAKIAKTKFTEKWLIPAKCWGGCGLN